MDKIEVSLEQLINDLKRLDQFEDFDFKDPKIVEIINYIYKSVSTDTLKIEKEAYKRGFDAGYEIGDDAGYNEGYEAGVRSVDENE